MVVFDGVAGAQDFRPLQPRNGADKLAAARPPAARSRCRSDKSCGRQALPARGKSGGCRGRRSGRSCPRSTGSSAGPRLSIRPEYMAERGRFSRMMAWVAARRPGDVADDLRRRDRRSQRRERLRRIVARLRLERRPVDASGRRGAAASPSSAGRAEGRRARASPTARRTAPRRSDRRAWCARRDGSGPAGTCRW